MGIGEQLADQPFGRGVVALAEVDVADVAGGVDQVVGRPVLVAVGVPRVVVVVDGDRVLDAEIGRLAAHVGDDVLEGELRRVHADHHQAVVGVLLRYQASTWGRVRWQLMHE